MNRIIVAVLSVIILLFPLLAFSSTVYAASSVIKDPKEDAVPDYMDIILAKVTEQRGRETLFLSMVVASPIPAQPAENALYWSWHLDTDPNSSPNN